MDACIWRANRDARRKLWDLLPVLRRNVYHPDFGGGYSLKKVLPALVPGMWYEDLPVADGSQAGRAWVRLVSESNPGERARLRESLSAYCAQDTIALACVLDILVRLPSSDNELRLPAPLNALSRGRPNSERVH